jgi:hypothetical protein
LYIEMITRVTSQSLQPSYGQEKSALESVYSLFPLTREIIKKNGRYCINFSKIAVVVLNQKVRPFTTKWHTSFLVDISLSTEDRRIFREELLRLQKDLEKYTGLLAEMANVEDISNINHNL